METSTVDPDRNTRSTSEFIEPLDLDADDARACRRLTETLRTYGLALVRSSSFRAGVRRDFLDSMTSYIADSLVLRNGDLRIEFPHADLRERLGYQYGPTPIGAETALCAQEENHERCKAFVDRLEPQFMPRTVPGSSYPDRKGRFMAHLVTYRDVAAQGEVVDTLDADPHTVVASDPRNVVPEAFGAERAAQWTRTVNTFGVMMLEPLTTISLMLARGLGLSDRYFVDLMHDAHHKVAPTYASFHADREPGTIQAALHEDIDVFAIHAQGTHSGLFVYTETGVRLRVAVPEGCLLVQAGRQLYLKMRSMERAGEIDVAPIRPGWHEVIVTPDAFEKARPAVAAIDAILARDDLTEAQKLDSIRPLYRDCIRISCTFFYHFGDSTKLVYGLPDGELEEGTFPEGTKIQRYIGLELGFIKLRE